MSDSPKEPVVHQEAADVPPQKKGLKRHCARFWWIYLIAFIIVAVLLIVLIILVAVPKIAQKKLDEAELTIEGIQISDVQSGSLTMAINSTIYADDSVHATIEPFAGVMYLEDLEGHEPFAVIDFPETSTKKVQTVNVTQNLEITNLEALTTFNTWLISNKTVRVTVQGDTKIHVKGLPKAYGATFKKTLELNGLDNFSGIEVTDATISVLGDENGHNFKGFVNIPNHSIFTLEIGNASFSTTFEGEDIGITNLVDLRLFPGDVNNITMQAGIEQLPILRANTKKPYCEGAAFPIHLSGLNVTNNGQNLTYYGAALSTTTQIVDIPIGEFLERDLNIVAKCDE